MVVIQFKETNHFSRVLSKIKDNHFKEKIRKQILKIIQNPEIGKPMMHGRKRTRELYIKPFRLSYAYLKNENELIFLDIYHKKKQ